MDLTRFQDVKFGLHTEMWAGCLFFSAILTDPAQNLYPHGNCHPPHTNSLKLR